MTTVRHRPDGRRSAERVPGTRVLRTTEEAAAHVAGICFKTGPPELLGVELEWTVHHTADPTRPLRPEALRAALGPHAPPTLDPDTPHRPLPGGGLVTVEPGGQVEVSTPPNPSIASLAARLSADQRYLARRLGGAGLMLGTAGIDPVRPPRRLLHTPRYDAMAAAFARRGPDGLAMMCSTAGLQVCIDAGPPGQLPARWRAVHEVGPVLLAAFANSRHFAGRDTGWASGRMRAWLGLNPAMLATDPSLLSGGDTAGDAASWWAHHAVHWPVLCVRAARGPWHSPVGVTFADWIGGALPEPPTIDDLEYHLTTVFPLVRPRGYLEVRYLDAQPAGEWIAPVAVLAALFADDRTVDAARQAAAPATGRWVTAARYGLADPVLRRVARDVLELACGWLDRTDLPAGARELTVGVVRRRLGQAPQNGGKP